MKRALIFSVILLLPMCGCGQRSVVGPVDQTRAKLQAISGAYRAATLKADQAPSKPDDLLPFLGDESTSEAQKRETFRSDFHQLPNCHSLPGHPSKVEWHESQNCTLPPRVAICRN